jgi:ElaB/YqjD/DUF883 family membrane-anchored ribosome-binding protein
MAGSAGSTGSSEAREAAQDMEELRSQMETLKSDIASIGTTLSDLVKNSARAGRGKAERVAEHYKRQGLEQAEAAIDGARAYGEALEGQIERNPFSAVLVALGLGFLVGLMSRR